MAKSPKSGKSVPFTTRLHESTIEKTKLKAVRKKIAIQTIVESALQEWLKKNP